MVVIQNPPSCGHEGAELPERALLAREGSGIDRLLKQRPFISAGGVQRREIAVTFHDGPYTPCLLDQLQRLHMHPRRSSRFVINPSPRRWGVTEVGDAIGDHTETHPMMTELSPAAQQAEIVDQAQQLSLHGPIPASVPPAIRIVVGPRG